MTCGFWGEGERSGPPEDSPNPGFDSPWEGVFFSFLGEGRVVFGAGRNEEEDVDFDSSRISFFLPEILAVGRPEILGAGVGFGLSRISIDLLGRSQI